MCGQARHRRQGNPPGATDDPGGGRPLEGRVLAGSGSFQSEPGRAMSGRVRIESRCGHPSGFDPASCRAPGGSWRWSVAVLAAIALSCRDAGPVDDGTPPPKEPLASVVVPLDASLGRVSFPWYSADGSRILAAAESQAFAGTQVVSFDEEGADLRCLTCSAWENAVPLLKPIPFRDGRRVLLRIGVQTPASAADHGVLECAPSVHDCREAEIVPIVPASADDENVVQDQREFRPAPDGEHVAYSQMRTSASGSLVLVGVVGRLVRQDDRYEVENARVVSEGVEVKQFTNDGSGVIVSRFTDGFEAANPDGVIIDLASGEEERLTRALDYDEPVEISPDGQWLIVGSGRTTGLFETVSQVVRPGFMNPGLEAMFAPIFLTRRAPLLEPWLVDRRGARGAYLGQALAPDAIASGWDTRSITNWKPDGTAAVTWQISLEDPARTRVVVFRMPARTPAERAEGGRTPSPAWAPALAGFVPADIEPPASRDGAVSGRAEIRFEQGVPRLLEVRYTNFSDDGEWVLDGFERSLYLPGLGGSATYDADLTVGGAHRGFLRADGVRMTAGSIEPAIVSEVDGRRLELALP